MACLSRRTLARLAGFLVLVALAPVLATLAWPHYRPPLRDGETYGLDVSSHQGTIDWPAVSRDGISAAYVKASEGGHVEGLSLRDQLAGRAPRGCASGRTTSSRSAATAPSRRRTSSACCGASTA